MTTRYDQLLNVGSTPQTDPLPGREDMVRNDAGGWGWEANPMERLDRFLILGVDSNTFYADQKALVKSNMANVVGLFNDEKTGLAAVARLEDVSRRGLAPKVDGALFVLACAISSKHVAVRQAAAAAVSVVVRTPYHMALFLNGVRVFDGKMGRGVMVRAVRGYFENSKLERLAFHALKYRQREGWTLADMLRVGHPIVGEEGPRNALFRWITHRRDLNLETVKADERPKWAGTKVQLGDLPEQVRAFEAVQADDVRDVPGFEELAGAGSGKLTARGVAKLVKDHRMTWEMLPTPMLRYKTVWRALLEDMPVTAMIRNLGRMTSLGVIGVGQREANSKVISVLADVARIRKSRVHPMSILIAANQYQQGQGARGNLTWTPFAPILDALTDAFYHAFESIKPTGKRKLVCIDGSGSMGWGDVLGVPGMLPLQVASVLAMTDVWADPDLTTTMWFDTEIGPFPISKRQRLDDVLRAHPNHGRGTDCAKPMQWALQKRVEVDAFILYTDGQSWYGNQHPSEALDAYNRGMGLNAKLVEGQMVASSTTLKDPLSDNHMTICGFDAAMPDAVRWFIGGNEDE